LTWSAESSRRGISRFATQPLGLAFDLGRLAAGEHADTFLNRATGLARRSFSRPGGTPFGRLRFAFGLQTLVSGGLANVLALIRPRPISLGGWVADRDLRARQLQVKDHAGGRWSPFLPDA
jgi:hypothetical protein